MKVTLDNISVNGNQSTQIATINENFQEIASAIENSLSRDGTSPNSLESSIDMNSNRIYNLPAPASANDAARLQDVSNISDAFDSFTASVQDDIDAAAASALAAANSESNANSSALAAASSASSASSSASSASASASAASQSAADALAAAQSVPSGVNFSALSTGTPDNTDKFIFGDTSAGDIAKKAGAHDTYVALRKRGSDISSASTINLDSATGDLVDVTGTTTITGITLADGNECTVRFTGALTLTHSASLILPGAASITTAAGDIAIFRGYSAGVVRCVSYTKADGKPVVPTYPDTRTVGIIFIIDNGTSAITTGTKGYLEIPFACSITRATALADVSGSIVVDVWKDTYANYPPVDADSITASAPITISSSTKSQDSTLTGWTKTISAGDILGFNVDSASTIKKLTIVLTATRT